MEIQKINHHLEISKEGKTLLQIQRKIKYQREYMRKYYHKNKEKMKGFYTKTKDKIMFGGLRKQVLERDNYQCKKCGMTDEEHKKVFGKEITIDHIDGKGSNSKVKNNILDNLQTLCLRCHGKKSNKEIKKRVGNKKRGKDGRFTKNL